MTDDIVWFSSHLHSQIEDIHTGKMFLNDFILVSIESPVHTRDLSIFQSIYHSQVGQKGLEWILL